MLMNSNLMISGIYGRASWYSTSLIFFEFSCRVFLLIFWAIRFSAWVSSYCNLKISRLIWYSPSLANLPFSVLQNWFNFLIYKIHKWRLSCNFRRWTILVEQKKEEMLSMSRQINGHILGHVLALMISWK